MVRSALVAFRSNRMSRMRFTQYARCIYFRQDHAPGPFLEAVEFSLQMPGNAALFTVLCAVAVREASAKGARVAWDRRAQRG